MFLAGLNKTIIISNIALDKSSSWWSIEKQILVCRIFPKHAPFGLLACIEVNQLFLSFYLGPSSFVPLTYFAASDIHQPFVVGLFC
jgi:hypothetical protein